MLHPRLSEAPRFAGALFPGVPSLTVGLVSPAPVVPAKVSDVALVGPNGVKLHTRHRAFKGKPVHFWVKDMKPGDRVGDGFNNVRRQAKP